MKKLSLLLLVIAVTLFSTVTVAASGQEENKLTEETETAIAITYEDLAPTTLLEQTTEVPLLSDKISPVDVVVVTENGVAYIKKTYILPVGSDPQNLVGTEFTEGDYIYNYSEMLKRENPPKVESKLVSAVVEFETEKNDKSIILAELAPITEYNEDGFIGQLALDSGSIFTEATGYTSYNYTVTKRQEYSPLDRNDPYTMEKDKVVSGVGMILTDVDWSAVSSEIVGDSLVPTAYSGDAFYEGVATGSYANGYITTATYVGTISREVPTDITYTIIYKGEAVPPPPEELPVVPIAVGSTALGGGIFYCVFFFFKKRNTKIYNLQGDEFVLIDKQRLTTDNPRVDLRSLITISHSNSFMITLDDGISRKLFGKNLVVDAGNEVFTKRVDSSDNFRFELTILQRSI